MQENKLLNIIGNFAYKNNLSLNIIGVSDTNLEIQYYKNILKNIKFNFLKKRKKLIVHIKISQKCSIL